MVLAGDPLELRFKMTVGTAQVGGTYQDLARFTGEAPIGVRRLGQRIFQMRRLDLHSGREPNQNLVRRPTMNPCGKALRMIGLSRVCAK